MSGAVPPLSVVMPVHNGMPFVAQSIRSILEQSFADFELVIGNDGSSDGTTEVLEAFARADPRIRLHRRACKSGVALSQNWVISSSVSSLVAIAHADDVAHPDRLKRQYEAARARPEAVAIGTLFDGIDAAGRTVQPAGHWRLTRVSPFAPFGHSTLMMRRDSFNQAGGYRAEANYWEDLELYWRLLRLGPILVLPEVLTSYRHSSNSIRSRDKADEVESAIDTMYRASRCFSQGRDHSPLLAGQLESGVRPKVDPRVFIARSWTSVWTAQRPGTLMRLLQRGDLRFDRTSLLSLAFVLSATVSPRAVRLVVRTWTIVRNAVARSRLPKRVAHWRIPARSKRLLPAAAAASAP